MAENEQIMQENVATEAPENAGEKKTKRGNFSGKRKDDRRERAPRKEVSDFDKSVVQVRRVQKVVKGGRILRFSALVVVGDRKGRVGIGI